MRERRVQGIVDRVVTFFEDRFSVVKIDGIAKLINDVEMIVGIVSVVTFESVRSLAVTEL